MKTMNENKVVTRSLERVKFWEWNPRGSSYRGMAELKESIRREGLQDAIHVWERVDGDYLLKGHRRFEAMRDLGWMECKQVVHHFEEEAAAYRFLLEDHGHTEPLSAEEKIVAVENIVDSPAGLKCIIQAGNSVDVSRILYDLEHIPRHPVIELIHALA